MASMKAEKRVGTQLFGQIKKEPGSANSSDGASKGPASKAAPKKAAPKTNQEPKKKANSKGGKSAAKH